MQCTQNAQNIGNGARLVTRYSVRNMHKKRRILQSKSVDFFLGFKYNNTVQYNADFVCFCVIGRGGKPHLQGAEKDKPAQGRGQDEDYKNLF